MAKRGRPSKKRTARRILDRGRRIAAKLWKAKNPGVTYAELVIKEN